MADKIKVDLEENSPYRVALNLAERIAVAEGKAGVDGDRKYWLNLYFQCRAAVIDGWSAKNILGEG